MKTTNHTPGPWALLDREENSRTLTHITNGAHIVCTLGTTRTDGSPNHYTNANLIAAAPDLLHALDLLLNKLNAHGIKSNHLVDAIAKAEGAISKAKGYK